MLLPCFICKKKKENDGERFVQISVYDKIWNAHSADFFKWGKGYKPDHNDTYNDNHATLF